MGHTDVVPVTPEGWSRDPFGGELIDGGAPGIHFYTLNRSPATVEVLDRLRA